MFSRLLNWYRASQRALDIQILWPVCLEKAADIDQAKAAFAIHAFNDPAWIALGPDEIVRRISELST